MACPIGTAKEYKKQADIAERQIAELEREQQGNGSDNYMLDYYRRMLEINRSKMEEYERRVGDCKREKGVEHCKGAPCYEGFEEE